MFSMVLSQYSSRVECIVVTETIWPLWTTFPRCLLFSGACVSWL